MKKKGIISVILAVCLLLTLASTALAGGLTVYNGKIDTLVSPANDYSYTMKVQNTSDAPMDIGVEVKGYGTSSDRDFIALETKDDKSPYTGRDLLAVSSGSFHLEPGDLQVITVTAKIPLGVGDGGRYAIVLIHTVPKDQAVATITAIAARVLLTIDGSKLIHSGEFSTVDLKSGEPLEALVTLTNTGNHHYKPKLNGVLKKGNKVFATASVDDGWPVVPGYSRTFNLKFVNTEPVPADTYEVDIELRDDSNNLVVQYSSTYTLEKPYTTTHPVTTTTSVPTSTTTPASSAAMIIPSSAATLKSGDGRISITFPKGAVTGQVSVSLQNYPVEQLPAPPSGYQAGTTGFRVDGLTGLLAEDATVKVQYTAADLAKADGNATRLKLARWDETNTQWTVLKTSVDKSSMTLATDTDRFSIWTIMVAPPAKTNLPLIIGGIVGGVIIISLLVVYFIRRRV